MTERSDSLEHGCTRNWISVHSRNLDLRARSPCSVHYRVVAATEDKISKVVEHYRRLLNQLPQPPKTLTQAPSSRLDVIVERAGAKRRSAALLAQLEAAFSDEGIKTFPSLTDPFLKSTDQVRMLDAAQPIEELAPQRELFASEKELQDFLWTRRDHIEVFRRRGYSKFKKQAKLDSGRRVDILCTSSKHNQLVAIELKVARLDDRAVGQAQEYIDDLAAHAASRTFASSHLIIVAGQPNKSARAKIERYAASRGASVEILLYRVQILLVPHP